MISGIIRLPMAFGGVRPSLYIWLGLTLGLVMPLIAAALFPTYMHQMQPSWLEWARLLELPFIACELAVIVAAAMNGHTDGALLRTLAPDVIFALVLLIAGLSVSSLLFSKNEAVSVFLSVTTIVHLRFASAIYHFARKADLNDAAALIPSLGLGLIALAALTCWRFSFPPPPQAVPGGVIEWASALPGFISVRHFGSWTGAIAAGLMVEIAYTSRRVTTATGALYVIATGLTCWSGTRAALLAMAFIAFVTVLSLRRVPSKHRLAVLIILTTLAYIAAKVAQFDNDDFLLLVPGDTAGGNAMSGGRLRLWQATLASWAQSPIFGWGSGATFWEVDVNWRHTQPHNVILQFLISWGLVGTSGGLWLLGRLICATHHVGMSDSRLRPLTAMLYALLSMSMLEGMLYYPRFIMPVGAIFAILFASLEAAVKGPVVAYGRSKSIRN
jgi:exopolysaccharide production protein ExoQ